MTPEDQMLIDRSTGADQSRVLPIDALRLYDSDSATFPLSPEDAEGVLDLVGDLAARISALSDEVEAAKALAERLKLGAQVHAQEARTANSTIYEIYQVLSGSTGEPGNWHGAEPARQFVAAAEAKVKVLTDALARTASSTEALCVLLNPQLLSAGTAQQLEATIEQARAAARALETTNG